MATIELRIPPMPTAVPTVRHMLGVWLDEIPIDSEHRADVLLVLSELVTNGVIHDGGDDIAVRATGDSTGITIEVVTADRLPESDVYDRQLTQPDQAGRGLAIAAGLAEDMSVFADAGRLHVRCHLAGQHGVARQSM